MAVYLENKLNLLRFKRKFNAWLEDPSFSSIFEEDTVNCPGCSKICGESCKIQEKHEIFLENLKMAFFNAKKVIFKEKNEEISFKFIVENIKYIDIALIKGIPLNENFYNLSTELAQNLHNFLNYTPTKLIPNITKMMNVSYSFMPDLKNLEIIDTISSNEITINEQGELDQTIFKEPVKILSLIDHWPALTKWNFEFLLKMVGYRSSVIEIGEQYTDSDWHQKIYTILEFLRLLDEQNKEFFIESKDSREKFTNKASKYYLAQVNLLQNIPILRNDIDIPDICYQISENNSKNELNIESNMWIGPQGTHSPKHKDPKINFYCQVKGSKLFKFEKKICFLHAGECIYIPKNYFHEVIGKTPSFGVNFWVG